MSFFLDCMQGFNLLGSYSGAIQVKWDCQRCCLYAKRKKAAFVQAGESNGISS